VITPASFEKWTLTGNIHTNFLPHNSLFKYFNHSFTGLTPLETNRYYGRELANMLKSLTLIAFVTVGLASASAGLFDVTSITDNGLGTASFATGTSNGIGFTYSGSIWGVRSYQNNEWQGFDTPNHVPALTNSDMLHIGVYDPTFTFDQKIGSALVYLGDDDGKNNDWFDFGVTATAVSGDVEVSGTAFRVTSSTGGVVQLTGINSYVLTTQNIGDGNDFAIVAEAVPEPMTMAVVGIGAAALLRRRRK